MVAQQVEIGSKKIFYDFEKYKLALLKSYEDFLEITSEVGEVV